MNKKPSKTKKQIEEERQAKIPGIRQMRLESRSLTDIAAYFEVSLNFVCKTCKDIKVEIKKHKKNKYFIRNPLPCNSYSIDELSEEEKRKYNSCKPLTKEEAKETFISGKKDKYWKAAIFEDSYNGNSNYKY